MKKNYYAIIPANVRYDRDLTPNAKLLYGEITALCNEKGFCWAKNLYFAELYGVTTVTISKWINELAKKGYITTEMIYKEGTKEIINRYIRIVYDPIKEKFNTPIKEKFKDNNTVINNTSNNTSNKDMVEIVSYLNNVAKKNYRHSTRKTQSLIKARMNEGFSVDDFKRVIDIKHAEWKGNPKMQKFIRPETLFGTKFESYLNQETKAQDSTQYDDLF